MTPTEMPFSEAKNPPVIDPGYYEMQVGDIWKTSVSGVRTYRVSSYDFDRAIDDHSGPGVSVDVFQPVSKTWTPFFVASHSAEHFAKQMQSAGRRLLPE